MDLVLLPEEAIPHSFVRDYNRQSLMVVFLRHLAINRFSYILLTWYECQKLSAVPTHGGIRLYDCMEQ
jgi:hypothetical protein